MPVDLPTIDTRRWFSDIENVMMRTEKVAERVAMQKLKELELFQDRDQESGRGVVRGVREDHTSTGVQTQTQTQIGSGSNRMYAQRVGVYREEQEVEMVFGGGKYKHDDDATAALENDSGMREGRTCDNGFSDGGDANNSAEDKDNDDTDSCIDLARVDSFQSERAERLEGTQGNALAVDEDGVVFYSSSGLEDDDQDFEFVGADSHDIPVGADGDLHKPRREHKRLKNWGKKNKKLRDKNPYGEENGVASYVAYSTNRPRSLDALAAMDSGRSGSGAGRAVEIAPGGYVSSGTGRGRAALLSSSKAPPSSVLKAAGAPFVRAVHPHHLNRNSNSGSSSTSSSSQNVESLYSYSSNLASKSPINR